MEEYDISDIITDTLAIRYFKKGTKIRHRLDGPAVVYSTGNKFWYVNGKLHRTDGPAVIDADNNIQEWWFEGELHREGGPAVEYNTGFHWYRNGSLHRLDGPAIDDRKYKQWWINGVRLSPEKEIIMNIWYENGRI